MATALCNIQAELVQGEAFTVVLLSLAIPRWDSLLLHTDLPQSKLVYLWKCCKVKLFSLTLESQEKGGDFTEFYIIVSCVAFVIYFLATLGGP